MTDDQLQSSQSKHGPRFLPAAAIILAVIMWGLAVALPVWETRSDKGKWDVVQGVLPAMIGWLGILALCPAWFANLLLTPLSITMFKARRVGFWLSFVAFAIAASAYMMRALYGDNETCVIVARRIGFYLWLGSFMVIALGHATQAKWTKRSLTLACWATVALMFLAIVGLEYIFPVGVSPLEATLKNPDDLSAFSNVLSRNPSQADKDAALRWVVLQDLGRYPDQTAFPRLEQLIAAGANVNQADRYDDTPLMQAVKRRADSMVALLVRAGADVNARDYRGWTLLDIAQDCDSSPQCQQILLNAGAKTSGKLVRRLNRPATRPLD